MDKARGERNVPEVSTSFNLGVKNEWAHAGRDHEPNSGDRTLRREQGQGKDNYIFPVKPTTQMIPSLLVVTVTHPKFYCVLKDESILYKILWSESGTGVRHRKTTRKRGGTRVGYVEA